MPSRLLAQVSEAKWAILPNSLSAIVDIVQNHATIVSRETFHQSDSQMQSAIGTVGERISGSQFSTQAGAVGILHIDGPIIPRSIDTPSSGPSASLQGFSKELAMMDENPNIKNIVLSFDSPGGMVTGVSEFADFVKSLHTPVTGFVYGYAASAAYWIASSVESLYASATAEVGSIGTVAIFEDTSAMDERRGVKRFEMVSNLSPNKRLDPKTDAGKAETIKILDQITNLFISDVAAGRKKTPDDVLSTFGQGSMFIASEAMDRGMVDGITTLASLVNDLNAGQYKPNKKPKSPMEAKMPGTAQTLSAEDVKQNHASVHAEIFQAGIAAEQARLQSIDALSVKDPSVASFVNGKKYEAGMTAEKMAFAIFNARDEILTAHATAIKTNGEQLATALETIPSAASVAPAAVDAADASSSLVADMVGGAKQFNKNIK